MHRLMENVERELENIANKGLSSSNLEMAYKLIDIYKDIKESKYYDEQIGGSYDARNRNSGGDRYMNDRSRDSSGRYNNYPMDTRINRYYDRIRDGMDSYEYDRGRYRNGDSADRLVDGMDMIMSAVCNFVDELMSHAETQQEKEVIRKHLNKMKNY